MTWDVPKTVRGPLHGCRVVELGGIGPGPHAAMMLADLGADVVRVDRPGAADPSMRDQVLRSRRAMLQMDLKGPDAVERLLDLVADADVLLKVFGRESRSAWVSVPSRVWPGTRGWSMAG